MSHRAIGLLVLWVARKQSKPTPVGFEPTRGDPIGLAGRRLNHSAKVSSGCGVARWPAFSPCSEDSRRRRSLGAFPASSSKCRSALLGLCHILANCAGRLCLNEFMNHILDSLTVSMKCCGMCTLAHGRLVVSATCSA
jgi:hypothetical protein